MEAIIPTKIGMPTTKTVLQDQKDNDEELIRQRLSWRKAKSYSYSDNFLLSKGNHSIQQKGMTMIFSARIFVPQKSL